MTAPRLLFSWGDFRAIEIPAEHPGDGGPHIVIEARDKDLLGAEHWRLISAPDILTGLCEALRDDEVKEP